MNIGAVSEGFSIHYSILNSVYRVKKNIAELEKLVWQRPQGSGGNFAPMPGCKFYKLSQVFQKWGLLRHPCVKGEFLL